MWGGGGGGGTPHAHGHAHTHEHAQPHALQRSGAEGSPGGGGGGGGGGGRRGGGMRARTVMVRGLCIRHPPLEAMSEIVESADARVFLEALHDPKQPREPETSVVNRHEYLGEELPYERIPKVIEPVVLVRVA